MIAVSLRVWFAAVLAAWLAPMAAHAQPIHPTKTGAALEALVRPDYTPTTIFSYDQARHHLFSNVDNNDGKVRLLYSGTLFAATTTPPDVIVNTEHVWPQSRFGNVNKAKKKADLHHLYPAYKKINESRSNLPFAEIDDGATSKWWNSPTFLSGTPGTNIEEYSEWVSGKFEPREACKGNVARAIFYFRTIYGSQNIDIPFFEQQKATLLAWHDKDPADAEELARNTRIAALQGKTNPFIDDATLAKRMFNPTAVGPGPGGNGTGGPASGPATPTLVENGEYHIMTWNLEWFFDADTSDNLSNLAKEQSADTPEIFTARVKRMAKIIKDCGLPHVVALQEVENDKVVQALADEINTQFAAGYKVGFEKGTDVNTEQDVAFLYREVGPNVSFSRIPNADFTNGNLYKVPSKHCVMSIKQTTPGGATKELVVVNCHLKAGQDLQDKEQRKKQARVMNHYLAKRQQQTPGLAVIVLGDVNTEKKFADTAANDAMGVLRGMETLGAEHDLIALHANLAPENRRTHPIGELDRILMNAVLADDVGFVFRQIAVRKDLMTGTPRASDHTPLVATFRYTSTVQP